MDSAQHKELHFDNVKTWSQLKGLIDEAVSYKDQYRYCTPMFSTETYDDSETLLDTTTKRSDVRKAYTNLRERYNEMNAYVTQIQINIYASAECVTSLMKEGRKHLSPSNEKILVNLGKAIAESKAMTRDFGVRHQTCRQKLKGIDENIKRIRDIKEMKSMYEYLKGSLDDLEKFTTIQESQIDNCREHLERYQPDEVIQIVQQSKDDVLPSTSPNQTNLRDGLKTSVTESQTTNNLNEELSEFSDNLNFCQVGSKRASPEESVDQTDCKRLRVKPKTDVAPKPSTENLFETLFDKPQPKAVTPEKRQPEINVQPKNPLKPYYDINSLHPRKRQYVGNNIVFPAFSHKRPRTIASQSNQQNMAYLPRLLASCFQSAQQNNSPQYDLQQSLKAQRNVYSIPNLSFINNQQIVIELTTGSSKPSTVKPDRADLNQKSFQAEGLAMQRCK